jgi:hypothetical protein
MAPTPRALNFTRVPLDDTDSEPAAPGKSREDRIGEVIVKFNRNCGFVVLSLAASIACADSLELKNGSLINGKFMGGTESEISFRVGSSVQKCNCADILSLRFDSNRTTTDVPTQPESFLSSEAGRKRMPA